MKSGIARRCKKNSQCPSNFCNGGSVWSSGNCAALVPNGGRCLQNGDSNSCISKYCACGYCARLRDGQRCATNNNCQSGWCRGTWTFGCRGVCRSKAYDGVSCSDSNYCRSGQCTCNKCGRKQPDNSKCATNDNCQSGWCHGTYTFGCRGVCKGKIRDGQPCYNGDSKSCVSGQCTCGYCGRKLPVNSKCATNDNCLSGWCNGIYTIGCRGYCKDRIIDYQQCPLNDDNECVNGRCEGVSPSRRYCSPMNGFRAGFWCNEDIDCDKTKSMYCKGGSFLTSGKCVGCPSNCPDGCNALFDRPSNMKCGRMTTFDHAASAAEKMVQPLIDFIECMSPIPLGSCGQDLLNSAASCFDTSTPCSIKLGGIGSKCLAVSAKVSYKSTFKNALTLSGDISPTLGLEVEADLTDMDMKIAVHGKIAVNSKIEFNLKKGQRLQNRRQKLYLSDCDTKKCRYCRDLTGKSCKPKTVYRKILKAGYLPVIIEVKIQAVALLEFDAHADADATATLTYNNDEVIAFEKAEINFDPETGVDASVSFKKNFNKNIMKTINIQGGLTVKGVMRIGPEVTVAVNGVPFKLLPAVRFVLEGNLKAQTAGRCVTGSMAAGIGLDAGILMDMSLPSPGELMELACIASVNLVKTAVPAAKAADCLAKVAIGISAEDLCTELSKEVKKLVPESLGVVVEKTAVIVPAEMFSIYLTGGNYCPNGKETFISELGNIGNDKRLCGGGGGKGVNTSGAPKKSKKSNKKC